MEPTVIRVEDVTKTYRMYRKRQAGWGQHFISLINEMLGRAGSGRGFRSFPALSGVSFNVARGEALAIIGRNGSGKSTLLQIIAGTLRQTSGTVEVDGQVAALLELGSGFNPEFSGKENVFLNAAILGMTQRQIEASYEGIIEFADIGEFIDQPVKTYSSGMRMRLAFAVLTIIDPEILIIDEALSVGDAFFQSRCVRWLEEFVGRGKTFICVSHEMFMIKRLCSRGIVLDEGRVVIDDEISKAANLYYRLHRKKPTVQAEAPGAEAVKQELSADGDGHYVMELGIVERTGDGRMLIEEIATQPSIVSGIPTGSWVRIRLKVRAKEDLDLFHFGFGFRDRTGLLIGGVHSFYLDDAQWSAKSGQPVYIRFEVQMNLKPQTYLLVAGLAINRSADEWHDLDCIWDCAKVSVTGQEAFWGMTEMPVRNLLCENLE